MRLLLAEAFNPAEMRLKQETSDINIVYNFFILPAMEMHTIHHLFY